MVILTYIFAISAVHFFSESYTGKNFFKIGLVIAWTYKFANWTKVYFIHSRETFNYLTSVKRIMKYANIKNLEDSDEKHNVKLVCNLKNKPIEIRNVNFLIY